MFQRRFPFPALLPVVVLSALILLTSSVVMASGVSFLPGLDRDSAVQKLALEPSVAMLTWELPGGLLVADRLGDQGDVSFGKAFQAAFPASQWFVVDMRPLRAGSDPVETTLKRLGEYGVLHLRDGGFAVVEVPAESLEAFLAGRFELQRIVLDPPPAG